MPTILIQQGDSTERLRRALGVRGILQPNLETNVVPVVNLGDLGDAPYALDPAGGAGYQTGTSLAANQATVGIVNEGPEGSAFLAEQIVVSSSTAAPGAIEVSRSGVIQTAVAPTDNNVLADTTSQCRPGTTGRDLPVRLAFWDSNIVTVGSICEVFRIAQNTPFLLPIKHLLRRGEVLYVKTLSNQINLAVGVSGRFWAAIGDLGA